MLLFKTTRWVASRHLRRLKTLIVRAKCTRHGSHEPVATALVELYVKVGRMRILSSPKVVESAELIARRIVDTYLIPNKTFLELREMTNNGSIDLRRGFSETCRAEFESLRAQF